MRKLLYIVLLFLSSCPTIGQKLVLEMNDFEVVYRQDTFGRRHQYDLINTLHYDKNLNLDGLFSIHEAHHPKHPILKGKFRQNKLVDSLVGRDFYKGHINFRGYFIENLKNTDTFNFYTDVSKFTFLGSPEGIFYDYDYQGKLYTTSEFEFGKKNGREIFYEYNHITQINEYLNGKRSGPQVLYCDFDDSVIHAGYSELIMDETYTDYKQYGKIHSIDYYYQDSLRYEITFNSDGSSYYKSYNFFDGTLNSKSEWYPNGQKKKYVSYDGDLKNGFFKEYYENGQAKKIGEYYCDSLEGKFIEYHENGKISEEGSFHRGWIEKGFRKYNENGKYIGSYSFNENIRNSGWIINGAYIKEDIIENPETFPAIAPSFTDTIPYSQKEKRLLKKYPEIKISAEIFNSRNEDFKEFGIIYIDTNDLTIRKKDIAKLQLILNTHICFVSPFLVNNFPSSCRLNGIIKWNENE